MQPALITIVELDQFLDTAARLLTEGERDELIFYIASDPQAGDIMPETGGVRKLRWAAKGKGKRGGVRVIYYYHDEKLPVFLIDIYAKNAMRKRVPILVERYRRRNP